MFYTFIFFYTLNLAFVVIYCSVFREATSLRTAPTRKSFAICDSQHFEQPFRPIKFAPEQSI